MAEKHPKRAPSLWLKYDYRQDGDILMQDVFVPSRGLAKCTYYCCLNWNTCKEGGGYCGIQDHPDGRVFIFSLWDSEKAKGQPLTVHLQGAGTKAEPFGGEGTGLKSMNFELGWKEDQWYTLVVRRWDSSDRKATLFGCWVHDQKGEKWTHLNTVRYPLDGVFFTGGTASFLEDWGMTSEQFRCVQYKDGFKRAVSDACKSWIPFTKADFAVNMFDVKNNTATENFDVSYDEGNSNEGVCIAAGGDVKCATGTCCSFNVHTSKQPNKLPIKVQDVCVRDQTLMWTVEESSVPQFGFRVKRGDTVLCERTDTTARHVAVAIDSCVVETEQVDGLVLELEDILGNCVTVEV